MENRPESAAEEEGEQAITTPRPDFHYETNEEFYIRTHSAQKPHVASDQTDLFRMKKLCDELRLALQRQREVNETLVRALETLAEASVEEPDCKLASALTIAKKVAK